MTIGDQLKVARNERGISLTDVANRTRVRERVISEIESDRYQLVGGIAYARGHIRTLAQIYGMNVESLLAEFDALHAGEEVSMSEKLEENSVITNVEKSKPSWKIFGMVAGFAIFAIAAFQVAPGLLESDQPWVQTEPATSSPLLRISVSMKRQLCPPWHGPMQQSTPRDSSTFPRCSVKARGK
jgi:cytoskeletal protein RodZ